MSSQVQKAPINNKRIQQSDQIQNQYKNDFMHIYK